MLKYWKISVVLFMCYLESNEKSQVIYPVLGLLHLLGSSLKISFGEENTVNLSGETGKRSLLGTCSYWKCYMVWCSVI
jgi:hypothetical protein